MKEFLKKVFGKVEPIQPVELPKKPPETGRLVRELLRENLSTISVDFFGVSDPIMKLQPSDRKLYLKKFAELAKDEEVMKRMEYLINKQAYLTLNNSKEGTQDIAGAMTINGIALVKDDIEKLASMYAKENEPQKKLTRAQQFEVMPTITNN